MSSFALKRNDRGRSLSANLLNGDGTPIDLTSSSVRFLMKVSGASTTKVASAAIITDAVNGGVRYDWASGDTDTSGLYLAEWEITLPSGKLLTVPNQSYDQVMILDDLG